jgi:hypothetical protein
VLQGGIGRRLDHVDPGAEQREVDPATLLAPAVQVELAQLRRGAATRAARPVHHQADLVGALHALRAHPRGHALEGALGDQVRVDVDHARGVWGGC